MRGRAGPVTEISDFATEISVTGMYDRDENFLIWTLQPGWPGRNYNFWTKSLRFRNIAAKMAQFLSCELALSVKLQESTKLRQSRTIQVYVPPFWLCSLISSRSTGLKFPIWTDHNISPSLVTGLIWREPYYSCFHTCVCYEKTAFFCEWFPMPIGWCEVFPHPKWRHPVFNSGLVVAPSL